MDLEEIWKSLNLPMGEESCQSFCTAISKFKNKTEVEKANITDFFERHKSLAAALVVSYVANKGVIFSEENDTATLENDLKELFGFDLE